MVYNKVKLKQEKHTESPAPEDTLTMRPPIPPFDLPIRSIAKNTPWLIP